MAVRALFLILTREANVCVLTQETDIRKFPAKFLRGLPQAEGVVAFVWWLRRWPMAVCPGGSRAEKCPCCMMVFGLSVGRMANRTPLQS